jgi:hypothetical protein
MTEYRRPATLERYRQSRLNVAACDAMKPSAKAMFARIAAKGCWSPQRDSCE